MTNSIFDILADELVQIILEMLSPQDRFNFVLVLPKFSNFLPFCKTWIFSFKSSDTMTQFNNTVKNVETFKVRKGGSNIAASSICCLAMFHKNTLKYFYIDDLPDTACVKHLAKDCKHLRGLTISSMYQFDEKHFRLGFKKLTKVQLNCGSNRFGGIDHFLGLDNLIHLEIVDAVIHVDPTKLQQIENAAPVKILNLSHCKGLDSVPAIFDKFTQHLKQVDLSMSEISNDCILNLVKCGGNVEQLSLNQCANISQSGFMAISSAYASNLTNIDLKGTSINDEALSTLISCCHNIVNRGYLNLSWCLSVTDKGFISALKHFGTRLRVFNAYNTLITDRVLKVIPHLCPGLEQLDVGGCYSLTEMCLLHLIQSCQSLVEVRTVDQARCVLSSESRIFISENIPHLKTDFDQIH